MRRLRLSFLAEQDIEDCLRFTHERFGESARLRYEALIAKALIDIATDPLRPTSREREEVGPGIRSYHFSHSRERARLPSGIVRKPRHFALYRFDNAIVGVGRILHDTMELSRHLPSDFGE